MNRRPLFLVLALAAVFLFAAHCLSAGYRPNWWGWSTGKWHETTVDAGNLPYVLQALEERGQAARFIVPAATSAKRDCSAFGCSGNPPVCVDPASIEDCPLVTETTVYTIVSRDREP